MGEREGYPEHDSAYRAGKSDFEKFVEHINAAMAERVDDTIPELPIKDLVSTTDTCDPFLRTNRSCNP